MDPARADGTLLEQPRHAVRIALGAAVLLLAAGSVWWMWPPPPEQVQGHAYAVPTPTRRIVVEVLNGTKRQGLARVGTRALRQRGIDVVYFGNADAPADSTRVFVRRGDTAAGKLVAQALGAGKIAIVRDTLRRVEVSVILGEDYRPRLPLHP